MKKYEVILFDLDDTLIDNVENIRYAFKVITEKIGVPYKEENFIKWYEFDRQYWIDRNDGKIIIPDEYKYPREKMIMYVRSLRYHLFFKDKITLEESFKINKIYINSLNEKIVAVSGAYELLKYLHDKYKIVIATNGPSQAVYSKLSNINCLDFIDYIFSSDMTIKTASKPKKEFFEELMTYINYQDREKILIVGDSLYSDIKGGMNSDIDTCWFNKNKEELVDNYNPTMIIEELLELKDIL